VTLILGHQSVCPARAQERSNLAGAPPSPAAGGFDGRPQTGHLQSATTHSAPLDSEADREVSPRKPEEMRDLPSLSAAPDLFQRIPVQIPAAVRLEVVAGTLDPTQPVGVAHPD
jgi:hypothetical protein